MEASCVEEFGGTVGALAVAIVLLFGSLSVATFRLVWTGPLHTTSQMSCFGEVGCDVIPNVVDAWKELNNSVLLVVFPSGIVMPAGSDVVSMVLC